MIVQAPDTETALIPYVPSIFGDKDLKKVKIMKEFGYSMNLTPNRLALLAPEIKNIVRPSSFSNLLSLTRQIWGYLSTNDSICLGLMCKALYQMHRSLYPGAAKLTVDGPSLSNRLAEYFGHPRDSHMCMLNNGRKVWMENGLCVYYPKVCCLCKRDERIPGKYDRSEVQKRNEAVRKSTKFVVFDAKNTPRV